MTTTTLTERGLKSIAVLGAMRDHGDRLRYMSGCRCDDCRRANSAYECARQAARKAGDWNGIVPATKARAHLLQLSGQGVGRRAVQAVTDVSSSILLDIRTGNKTHIRARTERKILAVTADLASEGALVPATATWKLIRTLLAKGYTQSQLAVLLGNQRALQISQKQVKVSTAEAVSRLYKKLEADGFTNAKNHKPTEELPKNTFRIKPGVIEHRLGD